jgi:transcriptional regulator GlxA family with amidase domain
MSPDATSAASRAPAKIPVAFLLDDGATVIDFAGPWEVFQDTIVGSGQAFALFTVAPAAAPIHTEGNDRPERTTGLMITPDCTFQTAPQPKIMVIGAQGGGRLPSKLEWIRNMAPGADVVLSVCTGAFILARTGLLDGMTATTHHDFFDAFASEFPRIRLVRDRRFVENGKLVTAGGLTSGVDAALHVVARCLGDTVAQRTAEYLEHDSLAWHTGARRATAGPAEMP